MARIYEEPQFEGSFESSAASLDFIAEQAIDTSKQERAKAERALQDEKTKERALDRQSRLDAGMLQGKQQIENATFDAKNAKANGDLALLKGLANFSTTAANAALDFNKQAEARKAEQEREKAANSILGAGGTVVQANNSGGVSVVQASSPTEAAENAVNASISQTVQTAAIEKSITETTSDPAIQEQLREPSANAQVSSNLTRRDAYEAAITVNGYIGDMMDSDTKIRLPDGRIIQANQARTRQELTAVALAFGKQYAMINGVSSGGAGKEAFIQSYVPAVESAVASNVSSRAAAGRKAIQDERLEIARETAISADQSGIPVAQTWENLANSYYASGKYNGNRTASNDAAMAFLLNTYVASGNKEAVEALAKTPKFIRPDGTKGPRLDTTYRKMFEDARDGVITENLQDSQRTRAVADDQIKVGERERQVSLANATTPEQERQINLEAADRYDALGTPEGDLKAAQLRADPNYSPFTYFDLKEQQEQGAVFSNELLGEFLSSGDINGKEAKDLGYDPKNTESADGVAATRAKGYASETKAQGKAAVIGALSKKGATNEALDADGKRFIMEGSGNSIIEDIGDRLNQEIRTLIRSNPDISDAEVRDYITRRGSEMANEVDMSQEGQLEYTFGGTDTKRSTDINQVVPTLKESNSGNAGGLAHDFRGFSPVDLSKRGDVAITGDVILNQRELFTSRDAIQRGRPVPQSIEDKAAALGTNAETLLRAQYGLNGEEYPVAEPAVTNPQLSSRGNATSSQYDTGEVIGGASLDGVRTAIVGKESGNNFQAVNPHSGALGFGQVMPANVGPWSREILGYTLSQREFLRSPDKQMAIINGKFRKMMKQQESAGYSGDVLIRRVASIWYSGQAKLYDYNKPEYYNGHPYPSIASYTLDVLGRYRGR